MSVRIMTIAQITRSPLVLLTRFPPISLILGVKNDRRLMFSSMIIYLQVLHGLLKLCAPVFIVFKKIKAGTGGTQENHVSLISKMKSRLYCFLCRTSIYHQRHNISEGFMNFAVLSTHTHNRFYLFFHELFQKRIVVPFINATEDQDGWLLHAFQGKPGAVYIGCLTVIDELHSFNSGNRFHPVFQALKGL